MAVANGNRAIPPIQSPFGDAGGRVTHLDMIVAELRLPITPSPNPFPPLKRGVKGENNADKCEGVMSKVHIRRFQRRFSLIYRTTDAVLEKDVRDK